MFDVIALVLAPPACPDDKPRCEGHAHPEDDVNVSVVCSLRLHHQPPCVSRGEEAATILDVLCSDRECRHAVVDLADLVHFNDETAALP